jgi:DNA repair protein RecO (recombination protein O)
MTSSHDESPAFILDTFDHGESDLIVTYFTRHKGRMTGIAKGAKRSKKRFVNKLEIFSLLTLNYKENQNRSLTFISSAELHSSFLNIRYQLPLYYTASVIREFILVAIGEREGDEKVFSLLLWALNSLNDRREHLPVLVTFLILFFDYIGYRPNLSHCSNCGQPLTPEQKYLFDTQSGGITCSSCRGTNGKSTILLSNGTLRMLNSILDQPLDRLHRLHFSNQALNQSLTMLHEYSRQLLQRDIHSWKIAVTL